MSVPASSDNLKLVVADLRKKLISITVFSFKKKNNKTLWPKLGLRTFLNSTDSFFVACLCVTDGESNLGQRANIN